MPQTQVRLPLPALKRQRRRACSHSPLFSSLRLACCSASRSRRTQLGVSRCRRRPSRGVLPEHLGHASAWQVRHQEGREAGFLLGRVGGKTGAAAQGLERLAESHPSFGTTGCPVRAFIREFAPAPGLAPPSSRGRSLLSANRLCARVPAETDIGQIDQSDDGQRYGSGEPPNKPPHPRARLGTYWVQPDRGFQSGRRDLNSGPLVPQTSALTRLRHAPLRD
jgi:hypothetical protein